MLIIIFLEFCLDVILYLFFIVIVLVVEYVGGIMVISFVMGNDFLKKLGLYCILLGDGVVIIVVFLIGGLFNMIYVEVIGVVMFIKNFNLMIMIWVVCWVIVILFCGKVGVFL